MHLTTPDFIYVDRTLKAIPSISKTLESRDCEVGNEQSLLVSIKGLLAFENIYNRFPVPTRNTLHLREEVVTKLQNINHRLPSGFSLIILDAWRSTDFQRQLLAYYLGKLPDLEDGYVSDPSDSRLVAPHTTGGTVDLTLMYNGIPLALGTDYDSFHDDAHTDALETTELSETTASHLRRLLFTLMVEENFAPYPQEWWHWSYGDQRWAAYYNHKTSLYNYIEPA